MKLTLIVLALMIISNSSQAFDLSEGEPFPVLELTAINRGEKMDIGNNRGEKLMLHLYASW